MQCSLKFAYIALQAYFMLSLQVLFLNCRCLVTVHMMV